MKFIPRLRKLEEHRRQHMPDCDVCGAGVGRHRRIGVLRDGEPPAISRTVYMPEMLARSPEQVDRVLAFIPI